MARASKVTGSLIVVLLAGGAVAEAATPRKGTARVVRETYAPNPYETIVVDYADPGLSVTTVDFTPRSGEDRVMVTLSDDSGDPVRGTVYQRGVTNERFCGQTDEPVAVSPSAELTIEVFAGPCGGSTSVPTEGTVEVKFLRSGAR